METATHVKYSLVTIMPKTQAWHSQKHKEFRGILKQQSDQGISLILCCIATIRAYQATAPKSHVAA
jgi:hypothetical protein